jgi:hypothetical protein
LYEMGSSENSFEERFQQLWRQSQKDEGLRTQELLAAFAGGGLSLVVVLAATRVMTRSSGPTVYTAAASWEEQQEMYPSDDEHVRQPQVGGLQIE